MKMPEPIIDPATIIVESSNPRPRTKPVRVCSVEVTASAIALLSQEEISPVGSRCFAAGDLVRPGPRRAAMIFYFDAPEDASGA
jgi:hypothetical protein